MKVEACFSDSEYQTLRLAYMRGKLSTVNRMSRSNDGSVMFNIIAPRKFCIQIESIINFDAVSAAEVFGLAVDAY